MSSLSPNYPELPTTESGSYYDPLLHLYRSSGTLSRFPMYDNIGTVRGLVDASGTVTDTYELDTFGRSVSSSGTTPNPYRFGGAWGYITDPSGMLQLGVRHYWPEVGRLVQQDPARSTDDWYAYVSSDPTVAVDPTGLWEDPANDPYPGNDWTNPPPYDPSPSTCRGCMMNYKSDLHTCVCIEKCQQHAAGVNGGIGAAAGAGTGAVGVGAAVAVGSGPPGWVVGGIIAGGAAIGAAAAWGSSSHAAGQSAKQCRNTAYSNLVACLRRVNATRPPGRRCQIPPP